MEPNYCKLKSGCGPRHCWRLLNSPHAGKSRNLASARFGGGSVFSMHRIPRSRYAARYNLCHDGLGNRADGSVWPSGKIKLTGRRSGRSFRLPGGLKPSSGSAYPWSRTRLRKRRFSLSSVKENQSSQVGHDGSPHTAAKLATSCRCDRATTTSMLRSEKIRLRNTPCLEPPAVDRAAM